MDWTLALEIFGIIGGIATVLAMFLGPMMWLGSKIDNVNNTLNSKMDNLSTELRNEMSEMRNEMKDFHGRLCTLEERYLQIITKK